LTPESAQAQLSELRERKLLYCEEPLPVEQILERAELRKAEALPIVADDSCFTVRDLRRELALNTFDILNIKTPRTGYTESLQMLALARAAGKGVMIGSQAGSGIGAARAALFAALPGIEHPSELSFFLKLEADILAEPIPITDGYMRVADAAKARIDRGKLRDTSVAE
jgi:L-alanine-DL-glutamate epimerase-like enolase superfamily enzyme